MSRLTINGAACEVREGATILDALRTIGVEVPSACHDPRLTPFGGCRLCTVKVDGPPRYVAACTTVAADGMMIETHPPDVEDLRRELLRMMVRDYPAKAVRDFPDLEFHRYLRADMEVPGEVKSLRRPGPLPMSAADIYRTLTEWSRP